MNRKKLLHAVLTGDIVNSTQLHPKQEKELMEELKTVLAPYMVEFYRGDSFQAYLKDPVTALRAAILTRALTMSLTAGESEYSISDVRISIGIGQVQLPVEAPGTGKGAAFLLSGRRFDALQHTEQRLSIASGHLIADIAMEVIAGYLDVIYKGMTVKQAAVIVKLLQGEAQQTAAQQLNKSKSTISELASAARWSEIEWLLKKYDQLINQLNNERNSLAD